jgi:hypothetical protein
MTEERRDDEIIGRALSRAIETIDVNETPFERSRIAAAPARRSIFGWSQLGFAVVGVLLAIAIGSWLTRPADSQPGVAASPTASAGTTPAPTPAATVILTPAPTRPDHGLIYFSRDGLPPVAAHDDQAIPDGGAIDLKRIALRIADLLGRRVAPPAGAFTAVPRNSVVKTAEALEVQGDLLKLDFTVPGGDWGIRGSAQSLAFIQQLVYTATEEPGIHQVLVTENGGQAVTIDQLVVNKPLTREDVSGYSGSAALGPASTITSGGTMTRGLTLTTSYSVDSVAPGLARFVVTIIGPDGAAATLPPISAYLDRTEQPDLGKAFIYLELGTETNPTTGVTVVDRSPLRAIKAINGFGSPVQVGGAAFVLGLDDARPWRVFTLSNPTRVVVDIGGAPQATSDSVAVYSPKAGEVTGRTITVSGAARAFEAAVSLRVRDSSGRVVSEAHTTASLGSSAVWGTFQTLVTIPANVSGNLSLEVFWPSPKDGAEMGLVQVPLVVR